MTEEEIREIVVSAYIDGEFIDVENKESIEAARKAREIAIRAGGVTHPDDIFGSVDLKDALWHLAYEAGLHAAWRIGGVHHDDEWDFESSYRAIDALVMQKEEVE